MSDGVETFASEGPNPVIVSARVIDAPRSFILRANEENFDRLEADLAGGS